MNTFKLKAVREILYSVGNLQKVLDFFVAYGGWNIVGKYATETSVFNFWELEKKVSASEVLLQSNHHPTGQLRLVKFENIPQEYIRSSQQPWDIGGIMDINLRVNEVANTFDELRELGWHGLSDPLLQKLGPFELYDILMKGYDDIITAFVHRIQPPMELATNIRLPSHIYNSSLVVTDLAASKKFYIDTLGCTLLNAYEVKKDSPQETMFGLPFNLADKVTCKACMLSFDGKRDVVFQLIEFDGVTGKDFSKKAKPPNRGLLLYRIEVEGIKNYHDTLLEKELAVHRPLQTLTIQPYGEVQSFAVISLDGVWIEFYEPIIK